MRRFLLHHGKCLRAMPNPGCWPFQAFDMLADLAAKRLRPQTESTPQTGPRIIPSVPDVDRKWKT